MARYRSNIQNHNLGYGVKSAAYLPDFANPLFSAVGTGIFPIKSWDIYGANVWVNPSLPVIGLPGIMAGSAILQPLLDTRKGVNGL